MKVSVIIPNWNTKRWIQGCLDGLRAQTYQDFSVIVVDSGSSDDSVTFIKENYPEVELIELPENRGFAGAVNAGLRGVNSEYVVLLNIDTVPRPKWLACLVQTIENSPPEVGCLASKMLNLQNPEVIDDAGDILSWYGSARKRGLGEPTVLYQKREEIFSACAGAALYTRAFIEKVGLFDERFVSYLEDIDLGLRGQLLGYRCLFVPEAEVLHQGQGAGTPRPRYVYLMTRNRLMLILKNIPTPLLFKHWYRLLFGQFYFLLVYKKPAASLLGYGGFLRVLPWTLRQRRLIQAGATISTERLEQLLSFELGEPGLREIIEAKIKSRKW